MRLITFQNRLKARLPGSTAFMASRIRYLWTRILLFRSAPVTWVSPAFGIIWSTSLTTWQSWPFGKSEYVILGPVVSFTTIEYWCRLLKTVWWDTPASLATSFQTLWILCSPRITSYVIWNLYLAGLRDCSTSHQNSISEACHISELTIYTTDIFMQKVKQRKEVLTSFVVFVLQYEGPNNIRAIV